MAVMRKSSFQPKSPSGLHVKLDMSSAIFFGNAQGPIRVFWTLLLKTHMLECRTFLNRTFLEKLHTLTIIPAVGITTKSLTVTGMRVQISALIVI